MFCSDIEMIHYEHTLLRFRLRVKLIVMQYAVMSDSPTKVPASNIPPFALRMQPGLKAALEVAARDNGRSLNAEILARLERSLDDDDSFGNTLIELAGAVKGSERSLDDHENRIERLESLVWELRHAAGLNSE
jgi:hypothetical protein